jgi:hypothetical protein
LVENKATAANYTNIGNKIFGWVEGDIPSISLGISEPKTTPPFQVVNCLKQSTSEKSGVVLNVEVETE